MSAKGYWKDPQDKECFRACTACFRCENKDDHFIKCRNCSGRPDPDGIRDPHPDDYHECNLGIMRWVTKDQKVIIRKLETNPFKGKINFKEESQDERDWKEYINQVREKIGVENWDPIQVSDL